MAIELVRRMGFDHYELTRAYIEWGPDLDIQSFTSGTKDSSPCPLYDSDVAEWVKKAIESAYEHSEYKPDDLKNFPLPATSGRIPHQTALVYMKVISEFGNDRRYQKYEMKIDKTKLLVNMFHWPDDPLFPKVDTIDISGVKRRYLSEKMEMDRVCGHMEDAAAFNVQKLIANRIKPKFVEKAVEEIDHQLSFVERYSKDPRRHGEEKVIFRRFNIWKDSHRATLTGGGE